MLNKTLDFEAHNYEPFNRAVDAEIARQNQLTEALRSQVHLNQSLILLRWAGIAALFILSIGFVLWLFQAKPASNYIPQERVTSSIDVKKTANVIQQNESHSSSMIKTKFTVFETMTTDTGKQVVTGRVYVPENLEKPDWQYCYLSVSLEAGNSDAALLDQDTLMRTLANKGDGQINIVTKDDSLMKVAKNYCRFI